MAQQKGCVCTNKVYITILYSIQCSSTEHQLPHYNKYSTIIELYEFVQLITN